MKARPRRQISVNSSRGRPSGYGRYHLADQKKIADLASAVELAFLEDDLEIPLF